MSRPNRNRRKRTVYLGPREIEAIALIRNRTTFATSASAIRFAILETARRYGPREEKRGAVARLLSAVEGLTLLPPRDEQALGLLCREVRRETGLDRGVDIGPPDSTSDP